jgi:hypothetical protein
VELTFLYTAAAAAAPTDRPTDRVPKVGYKGFAGDPKGLTSPKPQ